VPTRDARLPAYRPQLALLVAEAPIGNDWLHEIKLDGYRIGCRIERGKVALLSRRGHEWTDDFPEVAAGARSLALDNALFDGEVAAVMPDGRTSFQAMQRGWSGTRPALAYFVFDLLHLEGEDLMPLPLDQRKQRLRAALGARPPRPLRYVDHVIGDGPHVFDKACAMRLEGIVSKERAAPYRPAARSASWRKVKCLLRQELVVGGYEDAVVGGLGSLLLGYHDADGRLVYAGKVGTGFQRIAAQLLADCRKRTQDTTPFDRNLPVARLVKDAHWMKPTLVVEVAFTEWTDGGHIRHPSFQGVRRDKKAREVVREEAAIAISGGAVVRGGGDVAGGGRGRKKKK
jgi:bifunctional non-homologous end joining protein LigD